MLEELKRNKKWVLTFTCDKIPLTLSQKFIHGLPEDYATNDVFLDKEHLLNNVKKNSSENGSEYYTGDVENSGCSDRFSAYWLDYNLASKIVRNYVYLHPTSVNELVLGYVLTVDDNYTVIDLDRDVSEVIDTETQENIAYQDEVIKKFDSYTERSVSGKGYHIWLKSKISPLLYPKNNGAGSTAIRSGTNSPVKLKGFEIYSQDRYMTVTEDFIENGNQNIEDRQELLNELCQEIKKPYTIKADDQKYTPKLNDEEINEELNFLCCSILNSGKRQRFLDLFLNRVNYEYVNNSLKRISNPEFNISYPSRSEADMGFFALCKDFSRNTDVLKSLFMLSELSKRDKANRKDYLSGIIQKAFLIQDTESIDGIQIDYDALEKQEMTQEKEEKEKENRKKKLVDELINKKYINRSTTEIYTNSQWDNEKTNPLYKINELFADILYATGVVEQLSVSGIELDSSTLPFLSNKEISLNRMLDNGFINANNFDISDNNIMLIPPLSSGLLYELTEWSYKTRIKPVLEVSLTSSLGIISAIAGKMWQLPTRAGLNNYFILCAKSGIGKEGLHTTKDDVVNQVLKINRTSNIKKFILNEDFVSGQALIKYCATTCDSDNGCEQYTSVCNYQKEFGKRLSQMSEKCIDNNSQTLKSAYLLLYTGSARDDVLNGMSYSNKENNVSECKAPAFSIVGETTISGYAEAISPQMAKDGFLSRFITITYNGKSVPQNYDHLEDPIPTNTLISLNEFVEYSANKAGINLSATTNFVTVKLDDNAKKISQMIEDLALEILNKIDEQEHFRQAWNRAQLKILKLSALCAVGQNYMNPIITVQHIAWATRLVFTDIANIYNLISSGETNLIENIDTVAIDNIKQVMKEFITTRDKDRLAKKTKISLGLIMRLTQSRVVPFVYIYEVLKQNKALSKARGGYVKMLTETLKNMEMTGSVQSLEKSTCVSAYGVYSVCYKLIED